MTTIGEISKNYSGKIDFLDQELILAHALKKPREFVLTHPEQALKRQQAMQIRKHIARRLRGEPLAYILGHKEFFGLDLAVNRHTLVPRPETEILVEESLALLRNLLSNKSRKIAVIDIGTGSGNLIISIAKNISRKNTYYATDISSGALKVARQNARRLKVEKMIKFFRGDLLKPLIGKKLFEKKSVIIVANLPYLDYGWKNLLDSSETTGLKYEPQVALYSGRDGLDAYRKFAGQLKSMAAINKSPIIVLCEFGCTQTADMKKLFSFASKIEIKKDLAGLNRVAIIYL